MTRAIYDANSILNPNQFSEVGHSWTAAESTCESEYELEAEYEVELSSKQDFVRR